MKIKQNERYFPDALTLTPGEKTFRVSRENPACAFNKIIGNPAAVEQAEMIAYQAIGRANHRASELNVAWIGPPGVGKTMFARALANVLGLPFIELDPQSINNPHDIFNEMQRVLTATVMPARSCGIFSSSNPVNLGMVRQEDGSYFAPSCVVFIDEVHQLGAVSQSLLRATEPSTHILEGKELRVDTKAVMWQFATTDRGLLFDAFDTRFMKIELQPYTKDEIGLIIHVHNPDIPASACRYIANYYSLVTREALDAAKLVRMQKDMRGGTWEDAIEAVRKRQGIDEYGLSRKRLAVLRALGSGKKSLASLATAAGCKPEEMEKFILPCLMMYGEGVDPLVELGSGGRYITEAGLKELDKRGMTHKGKLALPKTAA